MVGLGNRGREGCLARKCRLWLVLAVLGGAVSAQDGEGDFRLLDVAVLEPPGLQAHLARGVELSRQGRFEGAAGVLADLAGRGSDELVRVEEGLYWPAYQALGRVIAGLDPGTRQAWSLLAETEAQGLLGQALEQRDEAGLLGLVRRYPGTAARDQALLALADLALERGRPADALGYLKAMTAGFEPARVHGRSLLAWAALGEWGMVRRILARLEEQGVSLTVAGQVLGPGELGNVPAWAPPERSAAEALPGLEEEGALLWLHATERPRSDSSRRSTSASVRFFGGGAQFMPLIQGPMAELDSLAARAVAVGERVWMRHVPGVDGLELATGRLIGQLRAERPAPGLPLPSRPGSGLAERGFCEQDGVLALLTDMRAPVRPRGQRRVRTQTPEEPPTAGGLAAWDLAKETWLWSVELSELPEPLDRAAIHAGPAVEGQTVAVLLLCEGTFTVAGFCLRSGALRWTRVLHGGGTTFAQPPALPLLGKRGLFFVATGAGAVAALCARGGQARWLHAYPRVQAGREQANVPPSRSNYFGTHSVPMRGFDISAMILRDQTLVLAPPDGDFLVGLHAPTGRLAWLSSRHHPEDGERDGPGLSVLVGADQEHVYLAGRRLMVVEIESGRRVWQTPLVECNGRGAITEEGILIPTRRGVLLIEKSAPFRQRLLDLPGLPAGPLVIATHGPFLLAIGLERVGLWVAPGPWSSAAQGLERARRLARCGALDAALDALPVTRESEPLSVVWSIDLARKAQRTGRIDRTRALLEAAARQTDSRPARLRLFEELFLLLDRSGLSEEARGAFETFLEAALAEEGDA